MSIEAELADGTILEFPDGTPDEVVQRAVKQHLAQSSQQPLGEAMAPPTAAYSTEGWSPTLNRVDAGVVGVNRGLANILGAPVDLVNAGLGLFGLYSEYPFLGSENIRRGMEWVAPKSTQLSSEQQADMPSRVLNRVGEEVGGAAIPTMGLLRKGQQVAQSGQVLTGLPKYLIEPFARNPRTAVATEAALATGGGTGAALVNEAVGERTLGGDLTGAIVGSIGTGGLLSAGRGLGKTLQDTINVYAGTMYPESSLGRATAEQEVGRRLAEAAQNPRDAAQAQIMARNLERAGAESVPLTAGQAMNDPGLIAMENARRAAGGPGAARFANVESQQQQALRQGLEDVAPEATSDAATRAALRAEQQRVGQRADASVAPRERMVAAAEEVTTPGQSPSEAGRTVRQQADRTMDVTEDIRDAEALPILARAQESGAVIDAAPVVVQIDDILSRVKREPVRRALTDARRLLNVTGTDQLDTTVSGLYETRKAIADIIAGRTETPTGQFAKRELLQVRDSLDDAISAQVPEWGDYLRTYREGAQRVSALKDSPVGSVTARSPLSGQPEIPDNEVVRQFFKPGPKGQDAIQQFEIALGGSKEAKQALRDFALDDAMRATGGDPKKLQSWLTRHREALSMYPDIADDLSTLGKAKDALRIAQKRADLLKDAATNPNKTVMAQYLSRESAVDGMNDILSSKNPVQGVRQLVRRLRGDKDALEGARRAMFDLMMEGPSGGARKGVLTAGTDASGQQMVSGANLRNFLNKNRQAINALYPDDPEHVKRLERIADVLQQAQSSGSGRTQAATGIPRRPDFISELSSRIYALKRGVIGLPYLATERTGRVLRWAYVGAKSKQVEQIMDEALTNPELAKTLLMKYDDSTRQIIGRRIRTHLIDDLGFTEADLDIRDEPPKDDENEDETR